VSENIQVRIKEMNASEPTEEATRKRNLLSKLICLQKIRIITEETCLLICGATVVKEA